MNIYALSLLSLSSLFMGPSLIASDSGKVTSRTEINNLIGIKSEAQNPDLKPGLHAAKLANSGPPPLFRSERFPSFSGRLIGRITIRQDGTVENVAPLYGPISSFPQFLDYAKKLKFNSEIDTSTLYNIYLCIDLKIATNNSTLNIHVSTSP